MSERLIQLNNRPYPFSEGTTVKSLMEENGFEFSTIIVKINSIVIEENDWTEARVYEGDNVEIIHLFGGG